MEQTDDPSPAEIAAMCEEIQAGWSEDERRRRRVGQGNPRGSQWYTIPTARSHADGEPVRDQFVAM